MESRRLPAKLPALLVKVKSAELDNALLFLENHLLELSNL